MALHVYIEKLKRVLNNVFTAHFELIMMKGQIHTTKQCRHDLRYDYANYLYFLSPVSRHSWCRRGL